MPVARFRTSVARVRMPVVVVRMSELILPVPNLTCAAQGAPEKPEFVRGLIQALPLHADLLVSSDASLPGCAG